MKHYRLLAVVALVACMTLILTVSLAQAQTGISPNGPTGGGGPGPVGASFTYQGRLKNAHGPVNGNCDFQFSLWDRSGTGTPPTGGIQIGAVETQTNVAVTDGLFNVVLNFTGAFGPTAFQGDGRWLQIAVRCPAGGVGLYATLSPRQPLWATPYAVSLMPGATISGSVSDLGGNYGLLNLKNTYPQGHALVATTYSSTSAAILGLAYAATGSAHGVSGYTNSPQGSGVFGTGSGASGKGVTGFNPTGMGVYGINGSWPAQPTNVQRILGGNGQIGVYGLSTVADGAGVMGVADGGPSAKGVFGYSHSGYAGYFDGNVRAVGHLTVTGNIYGAAKYFLIDHPLAPADKYLVHTSVESPDMKNVYDGVVVLDKHGEAVVTLPAWFEALNRDFRYQLTCIGGYAPVYIAEEVRDNTFKIAGGKPGLKVSWQITGIRQDPWANDHRIPVESDKPASERGTYLYPQGYDPAPEVK
ncbi:hypothetical protein TFLX_02515 [Thermoflexales bacterium]|nr:hypothetical protein TFLX_02515 [Thermoflexales bacterium]